MGCVVHGLAHVGEFGGISVLRETDGQASGGSDSGDWIFTIREKDPKNLENGTLQPSDLERNKVRWWFVQSPMPMLAQDKPAVGVDVELLEAAPWWHCPQGIGPA